jgi:hypothetical protein
MDFEAILQQLSNPVVLVGLLCFVLLIWRLFNTVRIYSGAKSYVKKTNKLRRKKYNGPDLLNFIEKKRKKGTNTYKNLRNRAKVRVEDFFQYKESELPGITNYSHGGMFKRSNKKITIFVSNGKKKISTIRMKKASKQFMDLANKYNCLNELIQYLHNLPEAILNQQEYDIYVNEFDVSIGYEIK